MKININGVGLEQYNKSSSLEDFKYSIESLDPEPFKLEELEIATEATVYGNMQNKSATTSGSVFGAVKTVAQGVGVGIKATTGAIGLVIKMVTLAKNQIKRVIPQVMKASSQFMSSLQNMYMKILKYDKRFIELGRRIDDIINRGGIEAIRDPLGVNITIRHHDVVWETIVELVKWCSSFEQYMHNFTGFTYMGSHSNAKSDTINTKGAATAFGGGSGREIKFVTTSDLQNALNNIKETEERIATINQATNINNQIIGVLNSQGAMKVIIDNYAKRNSDASKWLAQPFKSMVGLNDYQQTMKQAKGNTSTADAKIISFLALGGANKEIEASFGPDSRAEFIEFITKGSNAYLKRLSQYCDGKESSVIAKTIKKGGESANKYFKEFSNKLKREMDGLIKTANKNDEDKIARMKEELKIDSQSGTQTATNVKNKATGAKLSTIDEVEREDDYKSVTHQDGKEETQAVKTELDAINGYINSYMRLITIAVNTYHAVSQGLCIATYTLVEEGESICDIVDNLRGGSVPKYGEKADTKTVMAKGDASNG